MTIYAKSGTIIYIGRVGENLATDVVFDISAWVEEYGKGAAELVINQNGETYPQYTTREDNLIKWKVTNSNTSHAGMGKCELFYLVNEIKVKSVIYDFIVTNSLDYEEGAEPPAAFESWVEDVIENATFIRENITRSEENADAAEAWAVGTKNGEPLKEEDEQYNNNSKYYSNKAAEARAGAELAKDAALKAQNKAETAETNAETAETNAKAAQVAAEQAKADATIAKNAAETAQGKAETAQAAAEGAQQAAQQAKTSAETARAAAEIAEENAEKAQAEAEAARDKTIEVRDDAILINSNPPYMSIETGNWVVWNRAKQAYEDSGVRYSLSITRSYRSVAEMNSDVANMKDGDLVIIASNINEEDNSKLFVHDGTKWIYLSDLSGFQGIGIAKIERIKGNGTSGSIDVYQISMSDGTSTTFNVYNGKDGKDGEGAGDMLAEDYDPNHSVINAGGIENYIQEHNLQISLNESILSFEYLSDSNN